MKRAHLRPIWMLTGALAVLDILLWPIAGFSVSAIPLLRVLGVAALLLAASLFYDRIRREPAIADALGGAAAVICFTALAEIFSYTVTAAAAPLQDAVFARWDAAIGFDFAAHLGWVAARPTLRKALEIIYASGPAQMILIICGLALKDRAELGRFLNAYAVCALVVVVLGGLIPAIGPYSHHPLSPEALEPWRHLTAMGAQVEHFEALRAGTLGEISLAEAEGLVNFPSFHAVLAVLFAAALWRLPHLRWPGAALNGAMMFSALSIGGHYLVDLVAGTLLAFAALFWLGRRSDPRPS